MTAGRIDTGGIRMAYDLSGPEGAPVACLNHCFGSDLHYWDRHLAAFEGFRVLRYDTRGHGGSDAPPGGRTAWACWPPTWRDSRMRSASSGCTSAGCRSAGRSPRPSPSTTPNGSPPSSSSTPPASTARTRSRCGGRGRGTSSRRGSRPCTPRSWPAGSPTRRWRSSLRGIVTWRTRSGGFRRGASPPPSKRCATSTPPRACRGSSPRPSLSAPLRDPGAPREVTEKMARLIPNASLEWLTPARHLASLEHPERFNALVRSFLSKQV